MGVRIGILIVGIAMSISSLRKDSNNWYYPVLGCLIIAIVI